MIHGIPNPAIAILVTVSNLIMEVSINAWVTYTGADRWKPCGKTWIEQARLFLTTDMEAAIQFLQHQMNGAGARDGVRGC